MELNHIWDAMGHGTSKSRDKALLGIDISSDIDAIGNLALFEISSGNFVEGKAF